MRHLMKMNPGCEAANVFTLWCLLNGAFCNVAAWPNHPQAIQLQ